VLDPHNLISSTSCMERQQTCLTWLYDIHVTLKYSYIHQLVKHESFQKDSFCSTRSQYLTCV